MKRKIYSLLKEPWAAATFAVCSGVLLYFLLTHLHTLFSVLSYIFSVVSTILLGVVIAYILNPFTDILEQQFKKINPKRNWRNLSVLTAIILVIVLLIILSAILIPSLMESFATLFSNINAYLSNADTYIANAEELAARFGLDISELGDSLSSMIRNALSSLPATMEKVLSTSFAFGKSMVNLLIGFIFAIYFLLGKKEMLPAIRNFLHLLISDKVYRKQAAIAHKCNDILSSYIWCTLFEAVLIGVINAIFMLLFGIPYVPLISFLVAILNMLPTFGPLIGALIGGFILVLNQPVQALEFLIFTIILQTIDGYIIKPKLFGNSLGVPAVVILMSIIIGGKLFGVWGILFAIPIAAMITFLFTEIFLPYLKERKQK